LAEQPLAEQPLAEQPAEVQPVAEQPAEQPAEVQPVAEVQPLAEPQEVQKSTVPPLTINDSDDDMPPLVSSDDESSDESSDDIPQLVESSDEETDESDDEMPELVSDDEDIVHMLIRDVNCLRCRTAIQTLLSHDQDSPNRVDEECNTIQPKNEFPPIITHILWLFVTLHALNLLSTWYNM
jgi:type II secretory pathway component HofQ